MGTITQNLEKLVAAKSAIASAIVAKGGTVNQGDGFEEFAADIATIPTPILPYLEFVGTQSFTMGTFNNMKDWDGTIEYSTDRQTWTVWSSNVNTIASGANNKIYLRGTGNKNVTGYYGDGYWTSHGFIFTTNGTIVCNGRIDTLLDYQKVLSGEEPEMLPYCFTRAFGDCKSLVKPPELPLETLTNGCYANMFSGCSNLLEIPSLPATVLKEKCYRGMFNGCVNIKLSTVQTGEYQTEYRIPSSGLGSTATDALLKMFEDTGGTFTGAPSINTTYYTSNTVV